jgi:nitroreductase
MRNFIRSELGADSFAALLRAVAHGAGDFEYESSSVVSAGVATDRVEAWEPGFYGASSEGSWGLRRPGNFIEEMTHVCLDQSWLANCAAHFTFIADLDTLDRTFGPRGYRYAMLTAGRLGQRVYLACAALRIGCCGIGAFYDDEAARTLHLKKDTELLYLLGIGPVKKFV